MAKPWKELGRYGGVGIELVLAILILAGIGHWLDQRYFHGQSWGMYTGFLLGVAVGVRNLVRAASSMQRDIEQAEANDPEAGHWKVDESWVHPNEGALPDAEPASNEGAEGSPPKPKRKGGDDRLN
jgi:hypothetical protein